MSRRPPRRPASRPAKQPHSAGNSSGEKPQPLRVIGGRWRGTPLAYHGDPVTRPMKHRVREAIFNLVGPAVKGTYALDLFAGTGAIGIEALSRGATRALFIERHLPTAAIVKENLARVDAVDCSQVLTTNTLLWAKRDLDAFAQANRSREPWTAFVSPPYALFVDQADAMIRLVSDLVAYAPVGSQIVVEADERFDFAQLPGGVRADRHSAGWDVRHYAPAVVGVWYVNSSATPPDEAPQ
ncbi:MAG: RsmD family RNA methyltransferase [Planctomycetota bacterium]